MADVKLYALRIDGTETEVPFEGLVPGFGPLQKIVGGSIELLPHFEKYRGSFCYAFCNENGKHTGLRYNVKGHAAWEVAAGQAITTDFLVGDIAIVTGPRQILREHL